ncbi:MAG TPA: phospholipid carrier-dependent glycosyltransferase [Streptosporangiaceae bacterium]|nr:phospholipid carrier-dependent glycosyltransferase [Streptosporangiaceae bacterium]
MIESPAAPAAPDLRHRLATSIPGGAWQGWAGPLLVTLFGAFLRFNRLSVPHGVVFDETYYVPDAYGILKHGVEISHVRNSDALLAHGGTHLLLGTRAEYVAHPPLGKIMIAVGEWLFGVTPFGWRFAAALVGSLAILMTARIARRLTRSTWLGCVAGLLLALDGLEFVLSRTAILDIFVMFWILAAFGLIVLDRDRTRARLAEALDRDVPARLGFRWPLLLAGVCLGAACATKWNGVWYLPVLALLVVAWDYGAWRAAGSVSAVTTVARSDGPWMPVWFGLAPLAAYVASWSGWFATSYGYDRNGAAFNGGHPTGTILAWLQYQKSMLGFGLGLRTTHSYQTNPLGWPILARPISLYANCVPAGRLCGETARSTEQEVLAIGTPLVWWMATAALLFCVAWWIWRRDWQVGAVLAAVAAGWLPWIWFYYHDHRTEFFYYAVVFDPFLVMATALVLGLLSETFQSRVVQASVSGVYLLLVLANFIYLYPVLAARVLPYGAWLSRMWFNSWI